MITDKMVEDLSILDKKALSDLVVMSKDIADRQEKRISSLEGEIERLQGESEWVSVHGASKPEDGQTVWMCWFAGGDWNMEVQEFYDEHDYVDDCLWQPCHQPTPPRSDR